MLRLWWLNKAFLIELISNHFLFELRSTIYVAQGGVVSAVWWPYSAVSGSVVGVVGPASECGVDALLPLAKAARALLCVT